MSQPRDRFRAIAEDLADGAKLDQGLTVECQRVLDDLVRNTIRKASEEINHKGVEFVPGAQQPRILVQRFPDQTNPDEIRFICRGKSIEIYSTVLGESESDQFPLDNFSTELVAQKIELFLRRALHLSSRP